MRHIDEGALHDVEISSILSQRGRELPGSLPHLRPAGEGGDVGADQWRAGLGDDDVMWLRALPTGRQGSTSGFPQSPLRATHIADDWLVATRGRLGDR